MRKIIISLCFVSGNLMANPMANCIQAGKNEMAKNPELKMNVETEAKNASAKLGRKISVEDVLASICMRWYIQNPIQFEQAFADKK